jgi:acid phosphatase type 7
MGVRQTWPRHPGGKLKLSTRTFRLFALIAIASILSALLPQHFASGQAQTLTFKPVADAYVNKSSASRNYGTSTKLSVDGSPIIRGYLRFNISGLKGAKITAAKLRLYVVDDSHIGFNVARGSSTTWKETSLTYSNAPAVGSQVGKIGSYGVNRWIDISLSGAVSGEGLLSLVLTTPNNTTTAVSSRESGAHAPQLVLTLAAVSTPTQKPTLISTSTPVPTAIDPTTSPTKAPTTVPTTAPTSVPPTAVPTTSTSVPFLVAGDNVDCGSGGGKLVSDLILGLPGAVQLAGDAVWSDASYTKFTTCFEPTYGRFKSRIHPAIGNHEYGTSGADGYSRYFGTQAGPAGKFYYSYNVGSWHVVVLNTNCDKVGGCGAGSTQETWLKADLAANPARCTIAVWHHPRFSSGEHGNNSLASAFWNDLYAAGVELVFNGHDHDYERFAPQDPSGKLDTAKGIRQFIVGMGGIPLYGFSDTIAANSEKRIEGVFGVLSLTLKDGGYDWKFLPAGGKTASDTGSGVCH